MALADEKAALNPGVKPDVSNLRSGLVNYNARGCEYGVAKGYKRANYLRTQPDRAGDFNRYRAYISACIRHVLKVLDSLELHQATDPELQDWEGMKKAAFAPDTDDGPLVGASMLPHLCGAIASLNMAVEQAIGCGLLPADPGQPWTKENK